MAPTKNIPEIYAEAMEIQGKGHGFYEPESVVDVRPGVCGYINKNGQFQRIVDLTNLKALFDGNFDPVGPLVMASKSESVWKEIRSEGITRSEGNVKLGGSGDSAGVPVAGSLTFSLNDSVEFGAVLLCNQSVHRQGIAHDDPLRRWGKVNARAILKNCRNARDRGFWIVTTTWSTADSWANAWTNAQQEVSIGFKTNAAHTAELAPSLKYSNSRSGGGWIHPVPTVKGGKLEKRVIFFAGLEFKLYSIPFGAYAHEVGERGEESSFIVTDPDDEAKPENERVKYKVEVSRVGGIEEDEGAIIEQNHPLAQSTWERSRLPDLLKWSYFILFFAIIYALWSTGWQPGQSVD